METQKGVLCRIFASIIVLMAFTLQTTPLLVHGEVYYDAYSYEDSFEDTSGLNLSETYGFGVSDGALQAEASPAVAVSECISLPQPEEGTFLGWSFLKISLSDLGASSNTLEIQNCSGIITLLTINDLPEGESEIDLSIISESAIRLMWTVDQVGAKLIFWNIYGTVDGVFYECQPVVDEIVTTLDPVQINTLVDTSADFTDSCTFNTHTALWDWGDGSTSYGDVTESGGSSSVAGNHAYTIPGIYTVTLTVTDDCGNTSDISVFQNIVVFDPDDGFVTGGGWIDSPEGAYTPDPSLTGKANFGFVSKYKKGTTTPTGQTEFQLKVADLNFHSDSYEWLIVAGPRAQFKGTGTINGAGNYGFILNAIDGQISGGRGTDKFRIMIWNKDSGDGIVYDNLPGAPVDSDPETIIGGGSIIIHWNHNGAGDTTPPVVTITAPADDETVSCTVDITATATDNVGVTEVHYWIDSGVLIEDSSAPYTWTWDTTTVLNGFHTIYCRACDAASNVGFDSITVTVNNVLGDTIPPVVSITAPADGETVSDTVDITATATDNVGVTELHLWIDSGVLIPGSSYSWDTTQVSDGFHTIYCRACDAACNVGSDSITVIVDNLS